MSSGVERSSPSETIQVRPGASGCVKSCVSRSHRFHTLTKLRRFLTAPNGRGRPLSIQCSRRKKFARTPEPYTSGERTIAASIPLRATTIQKTFFAGPLGCPVRISWPRRVLRRIGAARRFLAVYLDAAQVDKSPGAGLSSASRQTPRTMRIGFDVYRVASGIVEDVRPGGSVHDQVHARESISPVCICSNVTDDNRLPDKVWQRAIDSGCCPNRVPTARQNVTQYRSNKARGSRHEHAPHASSSSYTASVWPATICVVNCDCTNTR